MRAAMQLRQPLRQRQADAQPAFGAIQARLGLREQVEHPLGHARLEPDAFVTHVHLDTGRCLRQRRKPDASAVVAVLRGVAQQVHEHLFEPGRIGVGPERRRRQRRSSSCWWRSATCARTASAARARTMRQVQPLAAHLDLAQRDARDVHQVVDQLLEVAHVAPDHRDAPVALALQLRRARDGDRAADGRQRIAQLVREHRQELVLAPVGVEQPGLGHLPRGDVLDRADVADGRAARRRRSGSCARAPTRVSPCTREAGLAGPGLAGVHRPSATRPASRRRGRR